MALDTDSGSALANDTTSKPLVSVITIFLNEEKFLAEAIESVLGQSYTNWELLLVDDGSTDRSSAIARSYAGKYPLKVRYLEHDNHSNLGMSASRNLGLRHARGEFVGFLDADDVWLSHKLERQVQLMLSHPAAAMVYGAPQLWHSWERDSSGRDSLQAIGVQPGTVTKPPALLTLFLSKKAITPAPSDILLRREIIARVNGFENSFHGLYEDMAFFTKVCLYAPIFVAGECWSRHRQHENSACSVGKKTGAYRSGYPVFLNWAEQYLSKQGAKNTELWKVLQKQLWPYRHPILQQGLVYTRRVASRIQGLVTQILGQTLSRSTRRWLDGTVSNRSARR